MYRGSKGIGRWHLLEFTMIPGTLNQQRLIYTNPVEISSRDHNYLFHLYHKSSFPPVASLLSTTHSLSNISSNLLLNFPLLYTAPQKKIHNLKRQAKQRRIIKQQTGSDPLLPQLPHGQWYILWCQCDVLRAPPRSFHILFADVSDGYGLVYVESKWIVW